MRQRRLEQQQRNPHYLKPTTVNDWDAFGLPQVPNVLPPLQISPYHEIGRDVSCSSVTDLDTSKLTYVFPTLIAYHCRIIYVEGIVYFRSPIRVAVCRFPFQCCTWPESQTDIIVVLKSIICRCSNIELCGSDAWLVHYIGGFEVCCE